MTTPAPKYELLQDDTITFGNHTLRRIRALRDFGAVKAGDLGGYVQSEENLSHEGACWVANEAKVCVDAQVYDQAQVYDHAKVGGQAAVCGDAVVGGEALVGGNAKVGGNTVLTSGHHFGTTAAPDAKDGEEAAPAPGM